MFSGGRDSTLAALRLAKSHELTLVTVTSGHLVGIEAVKARLQELTGRLPDSTDWVQVSQPALPEASILRETSCLPCHSAYVLIATRIAADRGIQSIALGYAGYQSDWPEQTPHATAALAEVLSARGFTLHLPVYDVQSKDAAEAELSAAGVTPTAMEQRCLRQHIHEEIPSLEAEIERWRAAITTALDGARATSLEVLEQRSLGSFR